MTRTVRLGAFILGALVLFAIGVLLIGDRQFLFERTYRLNAAFDTVAGLDEGATVRSGGVRIGIVDKIQLPARPGDRVTVVMKLTRDAREVIRKDSVASVETEGLLGAKYLALSFGSPESPPVHDGETLESRHPLDFNDLAKKASELMDTAGDALANVDAASADMRSIAGKIQRGEGTVGALVNDRKMYQDLSAAVADARRTAAEARAGVEGLKQHWLLGRFFKNKGGDEGSATPRQEERAPRQGR